MLSSSLYIYIYGDSGRYGGQLHASQSIVLLMNYQLLSAFLSPVLLPSYRQKTTTYFNYFPLTLMVWTTFILTPSLCYL